MKRTGTFILIATLVLYLLYIQTALAIEIHPDEPQYTHTSRIAAQLSISGATASFSGSAAGKYTTTTTTVVVTLQRKAVGGSTWTNIYSDTATSSGRLTALVSGTSSVLSGFSYRVRTVSTIKDSDGSVLERLTKYSSVISP